METSRLLCDREDPKSGCPGESCDCVEDTLEMTFDGLTSSVFEYETFVAGLSIETTVVTETRSEGIQGWSYGVRHDPAVLLLHELDTEGTDAMTAGQILFDATSMVDIQTCGDDPLCPAEDRTDGGGWVSGVVYVTTSTSLPLERNTLVRARYELLQDVGEEGTLIRFTDRLAPRRAPPVPFNLAVNGKSRVWETAVDGWIKKAWTPVVFLRGDVGVSGPAGTLPGNGKPDITDGIRIISQLFLGNGTVFDCEKAADVDDSGSVNLTDAIYLLNALFLEGPAPTAPFPEAGEDPTPDDLECGRYP